MADTKTDRMADRALAHLKEGLEKKGIASVGVSDGTMIALSEQKLRELLEIASASEKKAVYVFIASGPTITDELPN